MPPIADRKGLCGLTFGAVREVRHVLERKDRRPVRLRAAVKTGRRVCREKLAKMQ
jgi:hypothetical protein